jgi:hypothetical protein
MLVVGPPSGISQSLIVQSSDEDAIILSSKGLKSKSITGPACPAMTGRSIRTLPGLSNGRIPIGPPPPYLTENANKLKCQHS